MTELRSGKTRGGDDYVQLFVTGVDPVKCIGCGRCYKVCPRDVFSLVSRDEVVEMTEDVDDDVEDDEMMVMTVSNPMDCIGCQACDRVCPKKCHTHESLPMSSSSPSLS